MVSDAAVQDADVAVTVGERVGIENYDVRTHYDRTVAHGVDGVQGRYLHVAVHIDVALHVNGFQWPKDVHITICRCLHVVKERAAQSFHEFCACAHGLYPKVEMLLCWRHITVNERLAQRSVICSCIYVYLF